MSKPIDDSQLRDYEIICVIDNEKQTWIGSEKNLKFTHPDVCILEVKKIKRTMK